MKCVCLYVCAHRSVHAEVRWPHLGAGAFFPLWIESGTQAIRLVWQMLFCRATTCWLQWFAWEIWSYLRRSPDSYRLAFICFSQYSSSFCLHCHLDRICLDRLRHILASLAKALSATPMLPSGIIFHFFPLIHPPKILFLKSCCLVFFIGQKSWCFHFALSLAWQFW